VPTAATGNVSVPRKAGPLSTVAYLHGTSVSFYDAPSNPNVFGEFSENGESFDGPPSSAVFAGAGFIYIAPDYLGLGDSTVPRHRYFHAATEASSAADLLVASRGVLATLRVRRTGELFTFGFSQGGHAALALLLAYDDIYDVFDRLSDVFRQPYASTVPGLFDMQHFFDDVLAGMPPTSRELLTASFFRDVSSNPDHPLRVRLRQNAVDRWRPEAPIRVYHSPVDEEVPFEEVLVSVERLQRRGADTSVRRLPGLDHVNSWVRAMPRAARYFSTLE
jgi:pimeloyl-ACP methyl ester carboxylesterase